MGRSTKSAAKKAPAPKRQRGDKIARVRKHADGVVSVLANDPAFREQVVDALKGEIPAEARQALARELAMLEERLQNVARHIDATEAVTEEMARRIAQAKAEREGVPTAEQMEARRWLYAEMLKHGPAPTNAEIAEAFGSWL